MAIIKFLMEKTSAGKDVEKLDPLRTADGHVKQYSRCGKHFDSSSKI